MIICIDVDGTIVTHEYPKFGKDIGAAPVLKELTQAGHKLILYTMRDGEYLQPALDWFSKNDIPLYACNVNPTQSSWSTSRKVYANLYIDDAALGIPLKTDKNTERPYVNWKKVRKLLVDKNILPGKVKDINTV